MQPFFSYFGGKWRSSTKYPAPRYDTIIEPFAGAAGYSTRRAEGRRVILVEKDAAVAAVWRYLLSATFDDVMGLPLIAHDQTIDDLDCPEEAKALIGFRLNSAVTHPVNQPSSWMKDPIHGPRAGFWGVRCRARTARAVEQLEGWSLIEGSYEQAPDIEATWFIDPPYQGKSGSFYTHGSETIDYETLGAWCRTRRGQVIICEGAEATWLPFRPLGSVACCPFQGDGRTFDEMIWTNDEGK